MRSITTYMRDLSASGRAPSTVRLRGYQLRHFARWIGPTRCILAATRDDIASYLARPMSAETRASQRSALAAFYLWAVDTGRRGRAPTSGVLPVRRPEGIPRPCPDEVVTAALADADSATAHAIALARFAGLRAAEVAAVHTDDREDGRLRVCGKGGRQRVIPMHPQVAEVLAESSGWVFPSSYGGHWCAGTISTRVSAALGGGWTCHSLRHAFATEVYRESGRDLLLTQRLLGHSSPRTTARYVLDDDVAACRVVSGLRLAS